MSSNTSTEKLLTTSADRLVALPSAALRLGYHDAHYFRTVVASRHRISAVIQGARWFVWQSELDRALASLSASTATPAPTDEQNS